jgi:hypothetical protein
MENPAFFEEQKMNQRWLFFIQLTLLVGLTVCSLILIFYSRVNLLLGSIPFLSILAVMLLFRNIKLETTITREHIAYRFLPLQRSFRQILRSDIASVQMKTYNAIGEYGGWGIRIGMRGRAYTVKGNRGFLITLKSQKRILIGTARPEEALKALSENGYPFYTR